MNKIKVGPVVILGWQFPDAYKCFEITDVNSRHDMILTVEATGFPHSVRKIECTEDNTYRIFTTPDGGWIYEYREDGSCLFVDHRYTTMRYYPSEVPSESALSDLLRLAISCRLILENVLVLHAACVEKDHKAITFSAPSGTGKSTRAEKWVDHLGARWISGDRPCLNVSNGEVFGGPWDGKEQIFCATSAPLVYMLEVRRAPFTSIRRLSEKQAYGFLIHQLFIPMWDTALAAKALILLRRFIREHGVHRLFCDQTENAAKEVENILFHQTSQIGGEEKDMRLKDGFVVKSIAGEHMVIPTGESVTSFEGIVIINEISAFILNNMQKPISKKDLLALILAEYEVEEREAAADLDQIIETFNNYGIIEME